MWESVPDLHFYQQNDEAVTARLFGEIYPDRPTGRDERTNKPKNGQTSRQQEIKINK